MFDSLFAYKNPTDIRTAFLLVPPTLSTMLISNDISNGICKFIYAYETCSKCNEIKYLSIFFIPIHTRPHFPAHSQFSIHIKFTKATYKLLLPSANTDSENASLVGTAGSCTLASHNSVSERRAARNYNSLVALTRWQLHINAYSKSNNNTYKAYNSVRYKTFLFSHSLAILLRLQICMCVVAFIFVVCDVMLTMALVLLLTLEISTQQQR